MNEYGFDLEGDDGAGLTEQQPQDAGPKWFRDYMAKASQQMTSMSQELKALRAEKAASEMAEKFRSAGVDPGAVNAYQGDPAKVDEWLTANAKYLAKLPGEGSQEDQEQGQQAPAGPPATTVSPEDQAALQRMQEAGTQGVSPSAGSDAEMAARMASMSQKDLDTYLMSQGNPYVQ